MDSQESVATESGTAAMSDRADSAITPMSGDLTRTAYERIEEQFISMRLLPGSSLRTQDLQAMTMLGRTPVHQAVRRLGAETLFEILPRNGIVVAPIDLSRERRLAVLRRDMDRFVFSAAIAGMEANERSRLGYIMRMMEEERTTMSLDRFNVLDKAFDMLILQASRERFLERSLRPLKAFSRRSGYLDISQLSGREGLDGTIATHLAVMAKVMEGDVGGACAMSDELVDLNLLMLDRLEKQVDPAHLDVSFSLRGGTA